jgi:hypothetical protein
MVEIYEIITFFGGVGEWGIQNRLKTNQKSVEVKKTLKSSLYISSDNICWKKTVPCIDLYNISVSSAPNELLNFTTL